MRFTTALRSPLKKFYIKLISGVGNQKEFDTFSQKKVKFYLNGSEMKQTLDPPDSVYGMKVLDRSAFKKTVIIPTLIVDNQDLHISLKLLKDFIIKIFNMKPVQEVKDDKKAILLNPKKLGGWNDLEKDLQEKLKKLNLNENSFSEICVELGYKNWKAIDLFKAILPKDETFSSTFSQIGHIIHLNLKSHLLEYKQVIGEILLDKVSSAKTVVYKKNVIGNSTYRTFDMELICGEPNFMASLKEQNCIFEFDFSKVYWNPRLNSEHERVVSKINFGDVLFDVFAGIGPFAIPAAKKKCMVYANDLNPESFKWLNHTISLNKKCKDYIKTYNKDGGDFILNDVKEELLKIWQDEFFNGKIYFTMNLPGLAPTFIKYFKHLIKEKDLAGVELKNICLPIVICYFFNKKEKERDVFERESGLNLDGIEHEFHFVRLVSNTTQMNKISFLMPKDYLFEKSVEIGNDEPLMKKVKTN